jgi:hypothetical protein
MGDGTGAFTEQSFSPGFRPTRIIAADANNDGKQDLLVSSANSLSILLSVTPNPLPAISSISPNTKMVGDSTFTMIVNGSNFLASSVVQFNGIAKTTTFVNANQLTVSIPSSDLTVAGTFPITVFNPLPGGGTSIPQIFTVSAPNPVPVLSSISPNSKNVGDPGFTMTVNGSGFTGTSVVRFNGVDRATVFISSTQLAIGVTASDISFTGSYSITVFNPIPGGGLSGSQNLTVSNPSSNPTPAISSISPNSKMIGDSAFILTIYGTGFMSTSIARLNGFNKTTTFVNSTQLITTILASELLTIGNFPITVFNPAPGGGTSNSQNLTVSSWTNPPPGNGSGGPNPVPFIISIGPSVKNVGDSSFTLTVTGENFVSSSTVRFNSSDRPTVFVSSTQLTATIPNTDLLIPGAYPITVFNPAPGGGISNIKTY